MDLLVPVAAAMVSFVAVYLFLPWLIRSLRGTSLVGRDLNKPHTPLVPEMGQTVTFTRDDRQVGSGPNGIGQAKTTILIHFEMGSQFF